MSLALFSPLPRPVALAGRVYRARPARLRDVFALADLAADEPPAVPEGDPADAGFRAALRDAYERAEQWPGDWQAALGSLVGRHLVLAACLRDERLDEAALADIAIEMGEDDWRQLLSVAFPLDPVQIAAEAIDAAIGVSDPADPVPWAEAVAAFWADHPGMSEESLLDVTLPMFRLFRSGGKRSPVNPLSSSASQAARAKFWAEASVTT